MVERKPMSPARLAQWRAHYAKNKEHIRAYKRAWAVKNRDKVRQRSALRRKTEEGKAYQREYRLANKEKLAAYFRNFNVVHKERRQKYRSENRAHRTAYNVAWYAKHREELCADPVRRAKLAEYAKAFRSRHNVELRKRAAERLRNDLDHRIKTNLRKRISMAVSYKVKRMKNPARPYKSSKAGSAVRDLGCSIKEFMEHIGTQFKPGMSWDNWGEWHLDHIKPLVKFDLSDREHFVKACHFTNYQPLWAAENMSKGAR